SHGRSIPFLEAISFDNLEVFNQGGNSSSFLVKLDMNGKPIWGKSAGGYSGINDLSIDPSGNIIVTGSFSGLYVEFDGVRVDRKSNGFIVGEPFIVKYDSSGTVQWARTMQINHSGGTAGGSLGALFIAAAPDGSFYVNGSYQNCSVYPGENNNFVALPDLGGDNLFTARYDASGKLQWAKRSGTGGINYHSNIITDSQGDACITGTFNASIIL